jgi:hypothetical protein
MYGAIRDKEHCSYMRRDTVVFMSLCVGREVREVKIG